LLLGNCVCLSVFFFFLIIFLPFFVVFVFVFVFFSLCFVFFCLLFVCFLFCSAFFFCFCFLFCFCLSFFVYIYIFVFILDLFNTNLMKTYKLSPLKKGYSTDYSDAVDPSIRVSFATAGYRFGHSQVS